MKTIHLVPIGILLLWLNSCTHPATILKEGDKLELDSTSGKMEIGVGPSDYAELYYEASASLKANKADEAIKTYNRLLALETPQMKSSVYLGLGAAYLQKHDYFNSRQSYSEAIRLEAGNYDAHIGMGSMYLEKQSTDSAIQYYSLAKAIKPKRSDAYWGLALCYQNLKDAARAIENAKLFILLDPKSNYVPLMQRIINESKLLEK